MEYFFRGKGGVSVAAVVVADGWTASEVAAVIRRSFVRWMVRAPTSLQSQSASVASSTYCVENPDLQDDADPIEMLLRSGLLQLLHLPIGLRNERTRE